MASNAPQSPVTQSAGARRGRPAKRRRLNSSKSLQSSDVGPNCRITFGQFMSQPLAAFIDNDTESNLDIAKKIVTYFEERDTGHYAAVVANAGDEYGSCFHCAGDKYRKVADCRGKHIEVWKQWNSKSRPSKHDVIEMRALAKGLILETDGDFGKVQEHLNNVFGNGWAVMKTDEEDNVVPYFRSAQQFSFDLSGSSWMIWRAPYLES